MQSGFCSSNRLEMASKRVKTVNFKMDDEMHNITFSAVRFSIVIKLMAQSLSLLDCFPMI